MVETARYNQDRLIILGPGCAPVPERLLLAHARGQVLFVSGAGTSRQANLPDFRGLVLQTYAKLDAPTHAVLATIPENAHNQFKVPREALAELTAQQRAEVQRFIERDYDVVLGLLERRLDSPGATEPSVRPAICRILRDASKAPAPIHRSLMRLAYQRGVRTIVTTNFDLLLESACYRIRPRVPSRALGAIPRPSRSLQFSGVLHIHGALQPQETGPTELVITDHDFGEVYLRRRVIPDFIYDAARLFHIVLIGYSANDPPMRYLLNAVAADGLTYDDLKPRYSFVGGPEPADDREIADWRGRGIFPIPYSEASGHQALATTLQRWAEISPHNGDTRKVEAIIKRIVRVSRGDATEADRDLLDHLFRRSNQNERRRFAQIMSRAGAAIDWLDSLDVIADERV